MIKKICATLLSTVLFLCLCACSNGVVLNAEFNDNKPTEIIVGEMIDFSGFTDYTNGAEIKIIYSTPTIAEAETDSVYFQTEEVGMHKFTLNFSLQSKSKTLKCDIDVLPPAPNVDNVGNSVYCSTGETVTFDDIITRSGLRITPTRNVNIDFLRVDYIDEVISVENYSKQIEITEIDSSATSYTFAKSGSYLFYVDINNKAGSVKRKISASVLDDDGGSAIEGVKSSGAIFGENSAVKVMQGASESELSFVASDEIYELKQDEFYKTEVVFNGKNAPQIMLFADELNGKTTIGKGVVVSLEQTYPMNAMRIYGPDRLSGKCLVVRNNSFGRDNLVSGRIYVWRIIVTKLSGSKLAIKSQLFEKKNDELIQVAKFDWASFEYDYESKGYIEYLGSAKFGDILFRYSKPQKCDKDGVAL